LANVALAASSPNAKGVHDGQLIDDAPSNGAGLIVEISCFECRAKTVHACAELTRASTRESRTAQAPWVNAHLSDQDRSPPSDHMAT
jgi:hypothetical protein